MNFPASLCHVFKIGIFSNDGESLTTSVTGPLFSSFGKVSDIFDSSGSFFILFRNPDGISIFVKSTIR